LDFLGDLPDDFQRTKNRGLIKEENKAFKGAACEVLTDFGGGGVAEETASSFQKGEEGKEGAYLLNSHGLAWQPYGGENPHTYCTRCRKESDNPSKGGKKRVIFPTKCALLKTEKKRGQINVENGAREPRKEASLTGKREVFEGEKNQFRYRKGVIFLLKGETR